MPQITPFARAALIEFLVLSLFTGQMSKLPPHGTSPAGPARAPGEQRVPPRPGSCRAALSDGLAAEPSLTPAAPPGPAPLSRPPAPEPGPGRKGEPRHWDVGWNRPSPLPPTLPPPPPRNPSRSPGEARASLAPGYSAPLDFGRLRAADLRVTCEGDHGSQRCLPRPIGQEKSRRKQVPNTRISIRVHLRCERELL